MPRTTGKSPKARALGAELREARERSGVGVRELARRLETNHVKLSRFETGTKPPSTEDVASILTALGVTGHERDRLIGLARDADDTNWITTGASDAHREAVTLIEFERTASTITDVAPLLVPGLLQTADYARAIMSGVAPAELETRVKMRVGRNEVLFRRDPVTFHTIITEHALSEPVGGYDVMARQLRHIIKTAKLPNVTVRVIPDGTAAWHLAREGPFVLFEFEKAAPIVNLEHFRSSAFLYDERDIADYRAAVDKLDQTAMSTEDSVKFIARHADKLEEKGR